MTRSLLVLRLAAATALLTACEPTDQERVDVACSALCTCTAPPLPALQEQCKAQCRTEVNASRISDECLACVSAEQDRCATLEQTCGPVCDPPQGDPIADAGVPF